MIDIQELTRLKHLYIQYHYAHDDYKAVEKELDDFIQFIDINDSISMTQVLSKLKSLLYDMEHGNTKEARQAIKKAEPIIELFKKVEAFKKYVR